MRRTFADELYQVMKHNPDVWLLVGDLGYKVFDDHFKDFPERTINCGASEQSMLDIAVGLAYEKKLVFVYTITPFYYRGFETIRTYIVHENLPIVLIGSGRDKDYEHDGYSHDASDVKEIFEAVGLKTYFPVDKQEIPGLITSVETPAFISLKR